MVKTQIAGAEKSPFLTDSPQKSEHVDGISDGML